MNFWEKQDNPKEYYIEERDTNQVKADRSLIGQFFFVERYIRRVGYLYEPPFMPFDEVEDAADMLLFKSFMSVLRRHHSLDDAEKIAWQLVGEHKRNKLPVPSYRAQGIVAAKKRTEHGQEARWRRFWFADCKGSFPHHETALVKLVDTKRSLTGEWYPPTGGYDRFTGECDYEPGGLSPVFHHTVYKVRWYDLFESGYRYTNYMTERFIHPDDLLKGEIEHPILEEW